MSSAPPDSGLYVVLATRGVSLSKSRLAGALTPAERIELNRMLLKRTLHAAAEWLGDLRRCIVVSACREALALAEDAGACPLEEPGGAGGHNHAAAVGAKRATDLGASTLMLLPADLPNLNARALSAYERHATRAELVIAPDKDGTGTNSLIVPAVPDLQFFFGDGSLARYVSWGASRGWRVALHASPELAFDLDTPADYREWAGTLETAARVKPERDDIVAKARS